MEKTKKPDQVQKVFKQAKQDVHKIDMDYVQKVIRLVKAEGKTVDPEVLQGLKSLQRMIDVMKRVKGSPYKVWEELHDSPDRR
jgi:hypothetical protein